MRASAATSGKHSMVARSVMLSLALPFFLVELHRWCFSCPTVGCHGCFKCQGNKRRGLERLISADTTSITMHSVLGLVRPGQHLAVS